MTVRPRMEGAESAALGNVSKDPKAVLAETDPKLLRHVLDQLRSAGNAAFKSRQYRGTCPFVNINRVRTGFTAHNAGY